MFVRQLSLVLVLCATPLAVLAQDDAVKTEMKKFQGTWNVVAFYGDGQKIPADKMLVTIKDNTFAFKIDDKVEMEGTFALKPGADPKHFDITHTAGPVKDKVDMNIYLFDGETLKIASFAGDASLTKRPATFPKDGEKGFDLFVLKRAAK